MSDSSTIDKNRVAIVIPSYNEGDRLVKVVDTVLEKGYSTIIVINDNSDDRSELLLKDKDIVLLHHVMNRGSGAATETGLSYCRRYLNYDAVVTLDGDTQHDPDDLDHLLEQHFLQNADLTIGNRFMKKSNEIPSKNKFYNSIANITTSIICGRRVFDSQSGFKVFSKNALDVIELNQDRYAHCSEALIKAHRLRLKVIDVPISVYYPIEIRDKGQNFANGVKTFMHLLQNMLFKNN